MCNNMLLPYYIVEDPICGDYDSLHRQSEQHPPYDIERLFSTKLENV